MSGFDGQVALVTGASSGIGAAIAACLSANGARVLTVQRRAAVFETIEADLTDPDAPKRVVEAALSRAGRLDILINNAGITRDQLFMRMSDEEWQTVLAVNLTATMRLCRGVMRPMMKARWGRIINIGSVVGSMGNPGQANYAAAKAGLTGMTKAVAQEVASRGVTANCIAPGFITTAMTDKLNDAQREALLGTIPAGRMGDAAEIAGAAV